MNWKMFALGIPLIGALVACPPPPEAPSYTLGITPASLTFTKPTSGNSAAQTVTLTITPNSTFSSDLTATLVAPSGSTGVSAASVTIPAGATSAQLSVVASSSATVALNQAYTVQTSGGGIDVRTQPLTVTVNAAVTPPPPPPPPAPNFTVSATIPAAVTRPGTSNVTTTSTVTVTPSNGFTGNVALSAAQVPTVAGVTYSFNPTTVNVTSTTAVTSTLTATVSSAVPSQATAITTAVTVTGTGTISGASAARTASAVNLVINPSALDNILVTGQASLNLNTPVTFTAVGRDSGNLALPTQPTFAWSSSSAANVTVVAGTGSVTALKSISAPVTITASAGGKSGTFNVTSTFGMEASVGTYNQDGTIVGTAFLMRIRDSGGAIVGGPSGTQSYTITGPATWNNDVAATALGDPDFVWGPLNAFGFLRTPPGSTATVSAPVNGTYTLSSTFGAVTYAGKAQLADKTAFLPAPVVTATRTTTTVNSSWTADASAKSFRVQLFKKNGATTTLLQTDNQTALTRDYTGLTVATGDQFFVRVIAYPVDITAADVTPLPAPFNISSADSTPTTAAP